MSILRFLSKIISILLIFVCLLTVFTYSSNALDEIENEDIVTDINLTPMLSKNVINVNESAYIKFESNADVVYDSIILDGVDVSILNASLLEFEIESGEEGFGRFDLIVGTVDGSELKSSIYTYKIQNTMYLSEISHEIAWHYSIEESLKSNPSLAIQYEDEYSVLFASKIGYEVEIDSTNNNKTVFTGIVEWETSNLANTITGEKPRLPFRGGRIEVRKKNALGSELIGSGFTGDDGRYTITIDNEHLTNGQNYFIRVWLDAKTYQLRMDWLVAHYYFDTEIQNNLITGNTYTIDCNIEHQDTLSYKATYVHQAMGIAERFAEEMGFETNNKIRVAYPAYGSIQLPDENGVWKNYTIENSAFCWGNINNNCFSAIGKDSWLETGTIVHEYSHYIQCSLGNFGEGIPEILYMSMHDGAADYYTEKKDKSFAMHLSWAESWGYAFSTMAQLYYWGEYSTMTNQDFNISTTPSDDYLGEFQEKTIKAFLWSLVDTTAVNCNINTSGAILDYQIPWTPQEWWNMTTVSGTCRLPDFIDLIENESYNLGVNLDYKQIKKDIAERLTDYNIAPEVTSITFAGGDVTKAPDVRFKPNGSSDHPNNKAVIKIYDENYNLLAQTSETAFYSERFNTYILSIPQSVWNQVISQADCKPTGTTTFNISVEGYRDEYTDDEFSKSGPYASEYFDISITVPHSYQCVSLNASSHTVRCKDCGYEQTTSSHRFTYTKVDNQWHKESCSICGYSKGDSLHVLSNSSVGRFKECTVCGAFVDTGLNDIFPIQGTIPKDPEEETE